MTIFRCWSWFSVEPSRRWAAGHGSRVASQPGKRAKKAPGLHGKCESVHSGVSRFRPAASVAQLAEQLICNQQVAGSTPAASSERRPPPGVGWRPSECLEQPAAYCLRTGDGSNRRQTNTLDPHLAGSYPSGQRGQTVNLMGFPFAGSNPALPIVNPFGDILAGPQPAPG